MIVLMGLGTSQPFGDDPLAGQVLVCGLATCGRRKNATILFWALNPKMAPKSGLKTLKAHILDFKLVQSAEQGA